LSKTFTFREYNTASYGPGLRPKETPEERLFPNKVEKLIAVEKCGLTSNPPPSPYGSPSGSIPDYWLNPQLRTTGSFRTERNPDGVIEDSVDKARRLKWEADGRPSSHPDPTVQDMLDFKGGMCGVGLVWPPTDVFIPKDDFGPNFPAPIPQPPTDPPIPDRPTAPDVPQAPDPPPTFPPIPPDSPPDPGPPNKPPAPPEPVDPPTDTFKPPADRPEPDAPKPPSRIYTSNSTVVAMPDPITDPLTLTGGFYTSVRDIDRKSYQAPNMYHGWLAPGTYSVPDSRILLDDGAYLRTGRCIGGLNYSNELIYASLVDNMYVGGRGINEYNVSGLGRVVFPTRAEGSYGSVVGSPLRDPSVQDGYRVLGLGTEISELVANYIPLSTNPNSPMRQFRQWVMTNEFNQDRHDIIQYNGDPPKSLETITVYFSGTLFYYVKPSIMANKRIEVAYYDQGNYAYTNLPLFASTSATKRLDRPEIQTISFNHHMIFKWPQFSRRRNHSTTRRPGMQIDVLKFNTDTICPIAINHYRTYVKPTWQS
jgi:hypothetical protein